MISYKTLHERKLTTTPSKTSILILLFSPLSAFLLVVYGEVHLFIRIGEVNTSIRAFMVERLCARCILGMNFIRKYH